MQESGEMYLETILVLSREKDAVRAIDVGQKMGYSKPSVSRAMAKLRADGYLLVDGNGYLRLTDKGSAIAEKIYERHHVLSELLTRIGVSPETAAEDACRIEHVISDESFTAIKEHVKQHS
ncbi:MAG: metal-dependent transcriptional regulator [Clostridia bacterium]|nr:metal-dependent transcriptional regulator [Clostridia bacterium]